MSAMLSRGFFKFAQLGSTETVDLREISHHLVNQGEASRAPNNAQIRSHNNKFLPYKSNIQYET